MSGVEAIVGLASAGAGLVSLAVQLMDTADEVKVFCSSVKHADERLAGLSFDLETTALLLQQLESGQQNTDRSNEPLDRCIASCRRCALEMKATAGQIAARMRRSPKAGRFLWATKEKDVDRLWTRLERATSSLHVGIALHFGQSNERQLLALVRGLALRDSVSSGAMIVSQAATHHATQVEKVVEPSCEDRLPHDRVESGALCSRPAIRKKRPEKAYWRLHFKNWFNAMIWDLAVYHAEGAWTVQLRPRIVRPEDDRVENLCSHGDIGGLQRLLAEEHFSLKDQFGMAREGYEWRRSLLGMAALARQFELCRWLLGQATWADHLGVLACGVNPSAEMYREMYRLFVEFAKFDVDLDPESATPRFWRSINNTDCLAIILRNQSFPYHTRPIVERLELASVLEHRNPDVYLQAIGLLRPDAQLAAAKTKTGWTAMHYVAEAAEWAPQKFKTD